MRPRLPSRCESCCVSLSTALASLGPSALLSMHRRLAGALVAASSECSSSTPTRMNSMTSASALSSSSLSAYSKRDAGDRAEVAQDFGAIRRQAAGVGHAGKTDAAEKTAAPFDQRVGAHVDRRVGRRQQRLEAQIRIVEPGRAFAEQLLQRPRHSAAAAASLSSVSSSQRGEPVARVGAAAGAQVAGQRTMQVARINAETAASPAVRRVAHG